MKRRIRLTESDLHNIIKETVEKIITESEINEGVGDYFKAIRRGWNTPVHGHEFHNTKGALRAMSPSGNKVMRNRMNAEKSIGMEGYNTNFEQDLRYYLRHIIIKGYSPYTRGEVSDNPYISKIAAKGNEILKTYGKDKVKEILGDTLCNYRDLKY